MILTCTAFANVTVTAQDTYVIDKWGSDKKETTKTATPIRKPLK